MYVVKACPRLYGGNLSLGYVAAAPGSSWEGSRCSTTEMYHVTDVVKMLKRDIHRIYFGSVKLSSA